jgi:hypothetical protein
MIGETMHFGGNRLTALHFNENCRRDQATTRDGKARFNVVYPNLKKEATVRKILVDTTFGKLTVKIS